MPISLEEMTDPLPAKTCQPDPDSQKFHGSSSTSGHLQVKRASKRPWSNTALLPWRQAFDDVGPFDTRLDFAEDYDLWCRGALLGKRYANLPAPLTRYRQHADQVGQRSVAIQVIEQSMPLILELGRHVPDLPTGRSP